MIGKVFKKVFQFTKEDVYYFGKLSQDCNQIHFDQSFAESTIFKKPIVQGLLVSSTFGGLIGSNITNCIYLNQNLKFMKPVYIDEKIISIVTVIEEQKNNKGKKLLLETNVYGYDMGQIQDMKIKGNAAVLILSNQIIIKILFAFG